MSGPFGSAVVSEAVTRATSFLTGKYSEHKNIHEWIERLLRVRIKFESVVKVSEGFDINIKSLHEWQEKFKEDLCEAEEALSNFQAEIFHEKLNRTVEVGSSSHDQSIKEEGYDDATLVHPTSNLSEAVTRQVDLEANLPHDPFMHEEGSHDATLVQPASNLREAVRRHVVLEANLPHDPFIQEKGSHDATLVHPASNLSEAVTRQVDLEANLPGDKWMHEEGSDDATMVYHSSNLRETLTRQVDLEENPPKKFWEYATNKMVNLEVESTYYNFLFSTRMKLFYEQQRIFHLFTCRSVFRTIDQLIAIIGRVLKSPKILLGEYLENDEKVSKLIKTVEKLEKTAGDIGDFIELLKLQSKRNMCRKRKRSGVALQGFFLVVSLKLQAYALFCYGEGPYLLVIMLFRANFDLPTGITC